MKIVKNEENTITVLPSGDNTNIFLSVYNNPFDTGFISLNTKQARQVADEILRLCIKLESETKTD